MQTHRNSSTPHSIQPPTLPRTLNPHPQRRRIAELMSQLPLELDVEKLVGRALALPTTAAGALVGSGGSVTGVGGPFSASGATVDNFDG